MVGDAGYYGRGTYLMGMVTVKEAMLMEGGGSWEEARGDGG